MKMIDPVDGTRVVCMWDDCTRPGDTMYEVVIRERPDVDPRNIVRMPAGKLAQDPWKYVHYLFCCPAHKGFFVHSHVSMGRLPAGTTPRLL